MNGNQPTFISPNLPQFTPDITQITSQRLIPRIQYMEPGVYAPPTPGVDIGGGMTLMRNTMNELRNTIRDIGTVVRGMAGGAAGRVQSIVQQLPTPTPLRPRLEVTQAPGVFMRTGWLGTPFRMLTGTGKPPELTSFEYHQLLSEDFGNRMGRAAAMGPAMIPGIAGTYASIRAYEPGMRVLGGALARGFGFTQTGGMGTLTGVGRGIAGMAGRFVRQPLRAMPGALLRGVPRVAGRLTAGAAMLNPASLAATAGLSALAYAGIEATTSMITGMAEETEAQRYLRQVDWRIMPGITSGQRRNLSREMVMMGTRVPGGFRQVMGVAQRGIQAGLFSYGRGPAEFLQQLEQIARAMPRLTEILRSSADDTVRILGRLQQQGFIGPRALMQGAAGLRMYGAAAGMTPVEMLQFQEAGAQMARRAGIPVRAGAQMGAFTAAFVQGGIQTGAITPQAVVQAGGVANFTQGIMAFQNQVLSGPYGRAVMAAAYGGRGRVDPTALRGILTGEVQPWQLGGMAFQRVGRDPREALRFTAGWQELTGQLDPRTQMLTALSGAAMATQLLPSQFRGPAAMQLIMERQFGVERAIARPMAQMVGREGGIETVMNRMQRTMAEERIRTQVGWKPMLTEMFQPLTGAISDISTFFTRTFKSAAIEMKESMTAPFRFLAEYPMRRAGVGVWTGVEPRIIRAAFAAPGAELEAARRRLVEPTAEPTLTRPLREKLDRFDREYAQQSHILAEVDRVERFKGDLGAMRESFAAIFEHPLDKEKQSIAIDNLFREVEERGYISPKYLEEKMDIKTGQEATEWSLYKKHFKTQLQNAARNKSPIRGAPAIQGLADMSTKHGNKITLFAYESTGKRGLEILDHYQKIGRTEVGERLTFADGRNVKATSEQYAKAKKYRADSLNELDLMVKFVKEDFETTVGKNWRSFRRAGMDRTLAIKAFQENKLAIVEDYANDIASTSKETADAMKKRVRERQYLETKRFLLKMTNGQMYTQIYESAFDKEGQVKPTMELQWDEATFLASKGGDFATTKKEIYNFLHQQFVEKDKEDLFRQAFGAKAPRPGELTQERINDLLRSAREEAKFELKLPKVGALPAIEAMERMARVSIVSEKGIVPEAALPLPYGAPMIGGPPELAISELNWKSAQILEYVAKSLGITPGH